MYVFIIYSCVKNLNKANDLYNLISHRLQDCECSHLMTKSDAFWLILICGMLAVLTVSMLLKLFLWITT